MSTTLIWIVLAVLLVLVVALSVGLVLARHRRVRLTQRQPGEQRPVQRGGGYRAGGGITLSSGGTQVMEPPEHPAGERTEVDGQPGVGDDASAPRDEPRRGIVDLTLPSGPAVDEPVPPSAPTKPDSAPPLAPPAEAVPTQRAESPAPPAPPAPPAAPAPPATSPAPPAPSPAPPAPTPAPEMVEEIAPTAGRLELLRGRLSRSQSTLGQGLLGLLGAGDLDEDSWTEIEDTLLMADLGAATTTEITDQLRGEIAARGVRTPEQARSMLRDVLVAALHPDMNRALHALPHGDPGNGGKPAVLLMVGVNGTGKTTTTGKLARVLVADGRRVLLGAADTFRAAAAEQLATWAQRVGAEVVRGKEGTDPAAVAFEAVKRGVEVGVDAVLVDTAGRLHTKAGLMDELGKVKRVVGKQAQVDEVLLVLDATTGQNGLTQARVFADVVDVTGIVLTKLDGTAKGGIVFQVQRELGVPVKLVGLGEGPDDLAPFEPAAFIDALLG